jgi:hypothetical protein
MRQGFYYAVGAVGVGIGMLVTGNFLNINGRIINRGSQPSQSNSVTWVGAWWLIYVFAVPLNFIIAMVVFSFSPNLSLYRKSSQTTAADQQLGAPSPSTAVGLPPEIVPISTIESVQNVTPHRQNFKEHTHDFFRSARLIICNRVFIFIVLCTTTETLLIKGFSSYLSKYLEYQYRLAASTATMIVGAIGFVSLIVGVFSGAFLVKHFKWKVKMIENRVVVKNKIFVGRSQI